MSRSSSASALTLLELVVVLAILAVLAGVAVQSLEPIADQTRYELTRKNLDALRDAIVDDRQQSSGARQISGFVSDMGQLPESTEMLTDATGATAFTSVAPAISLVAFDFTDRSGPAASTPPLNPTSVDCTGVSLRCGWRGPYLALTDPSDMVEDGWGRPIGLGSFPSAADDVHLVWTAITTQYNDQSINVERLAIQEVSGVIQDRLGAPVAAEVALVYPNPLLSTSELAVMADADGNNADSRFRFENVPVGIRALVFKEAAGSSQSIRYIEVTPMQQANLTATITEF